MSANIKPGDLVMVVKPAPCCGSTSAIGWIGRASAGPEWATCLTCNTCGRDDFNVSQYMEVEDGAYHVDTLKKIEPPALEDDTETQRELEIA